MDNEEEKLYICKMFFKYGLSGNLDESRYNAALYNSRVLVQ